MKSDDQTKMPTTTLPKWTAMDILTSYADQKGWVTAKAGRPDVNRAGNASLSFCIFGVQKSSVTMGSSACSGRRQSWLGFLAVRYPT